MEKDEEEGITQKGEARRKEGERRREEKEGGGIREEERWKVGLPRSRLTACFARLFVA